MGAAMNCPACKRNKKRIFYSRKYGAISVRNALCSECGTAWVYKSPPDELIAAAPGLTITITTRREEYIAISPDDPDRNTDTDPDPCNYSYRNRVKADDPDFVVWYQSYPRKVGKLDAEKAWRQTASKRPPLAEMLAALSWQTKQPDWAGLDRSRYIPHPATYLRAGRWADEKPKTAAPQYQDLSIGTKWERRG